MNEHDADLLALLCHPMVATGEVLSPVPTVPKPSRPAVAFALWHRAPRRRAPWKKLATAGTRAELLPLMVGAGDFWLAELRDARLAGDTGSRTACETHSDR